MAIIILPLVFRYVLRCHETIAAPSSVQKNSYMLETTHDFCQWIKTMAAPSSVQKNSYMLETTHDFCQWIIIADNILCVRLLSIADINK